MRLDPRRFVPADTSSPFVASLSELEYVVVTPPGGLAFVQSHARTNLPGKLVGPYAELLIWLLERYTVVLQPMDPDHIVDCRKLREQVTQVSAVVCRP